ncbi:MAG: 50S ribosomal protein L21 [Lentimicrobiaceae bacterium]|nr:50S ribosomal protein L21 [Lentimicrobiaceae bacterium]
MYAIVDIAGQQFRVEQGQEVFVHRLQGEEGSQVRFEEVLLVDADGKIRVGTPVVEGAVVSAKILSHLKGDKVLIFKKKKRKGYQKLTGHRDYLTRILIEDISLTEKKRDKPKEKKEPVVEEQAAPAAETIIESSPVPQAVTDEMAPEEPKAKKPRKRPVKKVEEEGTEEK